MLEIYFHSPTKCRKNKKEELEISLQELDLFIALVQCLQGGQNPARQEKYKKILS